MRPIPWILTIAALFSVVWSIEKGMNFCFLWLLYLLLIKKYSFFCFIYIVIYVVTVYISTVYNHTEISSKLWLRVALSLWKDGGPAPKQTRQKHLFHNRRVKRLPRLSEWVGCTLPLAAIRWCSFSPLSGSQSCGLEVVNFNLETPDRSKQAAALAGLR